jgi:Fungal trichothecene efflux pump (TRI12)
MIGIWLFLTLKTENSSIKKKLKRVDVLGIVIFIITFTLLLFGITAGGVIYPWKSPNIIIPLVIAMIGLVAFWFIEEYVAEEPMIPPRVFKERTAFAGYIGTWAHGIILWGLIYYALLWVLFLSHLAQFFSVKRSFSVPRSKLASTPFQLP